MTDQAASNWRLRNHRRTRRLSSRPDHARGRRADLPDRCVRIRRHAARRRPVRPEGQGQHLHADHEPDDGRARAADRRARGRHRALALASGQSAVTYAIQTIAEAGDNIVSASSLYGGTYNLFAHTLPQYGITTRFADPRDPASFEPLIDARTKAIFAESVGNPLGNVTDIAALAEVAHRHGIPLIVDNTVPSPYLLRPFEHGADIVVHSLTKYLGGHGTSLGGAIVDSGKFPWAEHADRFKRLNRLTSAITVSSTRKRSGRLPISAARVVPLCWHGRGHFAVQCVPDPARHRNTGAARRAHQRQRAEDRAAPRAPRKRRMGELCGPARSPGPSARRALPVGPRAGILTFGVKGGRDGGAKLGRAEAVHAARQHRRHEIARDAPGIDDAPATVARRTREGRREGGKPCGCRSASSISTTCSPTSIKALAQRGKQARRLAGAPASNVLT